MNNDKEDRRDIWPVSGGKFCKRLDKWIEGLECALEAYSYGNNPKLEAEYKIRIDEAERIGKHLVYDWDMED